MFVKNKTVFCWVPSEQKVIRKHYNNLSVWTLKGEKIGKHSRLKGVISKEDLSFLCFDFHWRTLQTKEIQSKKLDKKYTNRSTIKVLSVLFFLSVDSFLNIQHWSSLQSSVLVRISILCHKREGSNQRFWQSNIYTIKNIQTKWQYFVLSCNKGYNWRTESKNMFIFL